MTPDDYCRQWAHECLIAAVAAATSGAGQSEVDYHLRWARRFVALIGTGTTSEVVWERRHDHESASAIRSAKAAE